MIAVSFESSRQRNQDFGIDVGKLQFEESASYVIGRGFPIVRPLHAEAGFNKVLCANSHIAALRLNRTQRIPRRNSTDSTAKGYNRKKHIKSRRCWRIRKFQSQYH
jgi:hypothetical protein